MQLFKSEWLREPRYLPERERRTGFASRYGVHVERDLSAYRPPVCMPEVAGLPTFECERATLWEIARYDRAA